MHDPRWGAISFGPNFPATPQFQYSFDWDSDHVLKGGLIVPEVICFADIPESCLDIHIEKYGKFGLSFTRHYLVGNGARSVMYIPLQPSDYRSRWDSIHTSLMVRNSLAAYIGFERLAVEPIRPEVWRQTLGEVPATRDDAIMAANDVLVQQFFAFLKVFDSDLDDEDPNNFYMEREWRLANPLPFKNEDVARVIVSKDYHQRFIDVHPEFSARILAL